MRYAGYTLLFLLLAAAPLTAQGQPPKYFISVDMEGIGGIGTGKMTSSGGKDYATGRELMTAEVNAVIEAILARGPADILVNDSHGDMQNLLHVRLDSRVSYIQGNIKPFGMMQGLDSSFDGVFFIGYHARAGTEGGFLAHTGSGTVKGLWLNDIEVGEGGLNAALAGELGVPVLFASGDDGFTSQFSALVACETATVKHAIGYQVARLLHPDVVRSRLKTTTASALQKSGSAKAFTVGNPVRIRMRFAGTSRADVLQAIPGMQRLDGYTVGYTAENMVAAYKLIRLMYKYVRI